MQPSNYMLDTFVAHRLSLLTSCGAPDLSALNKRWLNTFILTTVLRVRAPQKTRAYVFNFLRRTEGALSSYDQGRTALLEYLSTPRNVLSPYFLALLNFEICLAQVFQGFELLARPSGVKPFEEGDGSIMEKVERLYVDSKHMDQMIEGGKVPNEATCAIWITNTGLESKRASLQFDELGELFGSMSKIGDQLAIMSPSE